MEKSSPFNPLLSVLFSLMNTASSNGSAVKLSKGFEIKIKGKAQPKTDALPATTYSVKPTDFIGINPIPKRMVDTGQEVKAGDPLFFDKANPDVFFTAPVSGEVVDIKRGDKRAITEVVILADKEIKYKTFETGDARSLSAEKISALMKESGLWVALKQRPYNVIADTKDEPRDIFISGFDTAPLAPDYNILFEGADKYFQAGVDALGKLTKGKVYLGLDGNGKVPSAFHNTTGVEKRFFKGLHPAGNVGVQIHHIKPISKGEIVWTMHPQDVVFLGKLLTEGKYDTSRIIALAGSEVKNPQYYKTWSGANVEGLLNGQLNNEHVRVISGNVLTGKRIEKNGHLGFFENLVTVIEEGDFFEMMGWILPSYARPSLSPTFPWKFMPGTEFKVNTNTHGESRAMVITGQYEKVLPMDIFPQHLLKAIIANDYDQMEGLGIYEVVEEDLALCEFVCTSKTEVQKILREGLDYMREQGS